MESKPQTMKSNEEILIEKVGELPISKDACATVFWDEALEAMDAAADQVKPIYDNPMDRNTFRRLYAHRASRIQESLNKGAEQLMTLTDFKLALADLGIRIEGSNATPHPAASEQLQVKLAESLRLLRELAEIQNGPPLIRYADDWFEVMNKIWPFLKENEPPKSEQP